MRYSQVIFVFLLGCIIVLGLTFMTLTFVSMDSTYHFTHGPGCPEPIYPY